MFSRPCHMAASQGNRSPQGRGEALIIAGPVRAPHSSCQSLRRVVAGRTVASQSHSHLDARNSRACYVTRQRGPRVTLSVKATSLGCTCVWSNFCLCLILPPKSASCHLLQCGCHRHACHLAPGLGCPFSVLYFEVALPPHPPAPSDRLTVPHSVTPEHLSWGHVELL